MSIFVQESGQSNKYHCQTRRKFLLPLLFPDRTLNLWQLFHLELAPLAYLIFSLSITYFRYKTFLMLASPRIADIVAMICMIRTYLVVENQPNEERLADLERIARMAHSILSFFLLHALYGI